MKTPLVCVTGGHGFLGKALIRLLLDQGYRVRAWVRRHDASAEWPQVVYHRGDLSQLALLRKAVSGCDAVVHTAALAGTWGPWSDYYRSNVLGTQALLQACCLEQVPRLVYTSTPSVVARTCDIEGGDEALPYSRHFLCAYAQTKALAERQVLACTELATIALRPHLIWGPGDPHLLPQLMTRARAGTLVQIGPGTNRVDLTHIDNAALAHLRALEALFHNPSCVAGKAYFISDGAPVVLWQWVAALLARYQLPAVRRCVPFAAAYALGWLAEGFCRSVACFGTPSMPTMTRFVATQLAKSHWFKIDRARELLGYEPLQRDLSSLPACVEG